MSIEIKVSKNLVNYQDAIEQMNIRQQDVLLCKQKPLFWLLEHDHVYTAGASAKDCDLIDKNIQVIKVDRGGKYTYHGPGQKIGYIIADLRNFNNGQLDIRKFVDVIEKTIIGTLEYFGIKAFADRDNIGIWVKNGKEQQKIAAIGVKISK